VENLLQVGSFLFRSWFALTDDRFVLAPFEAGGSPGLFTLMVVGLFVIVTRLLLV